MYAINKNRVIFSLLLVIFIMFSFTLNAMANPVVIAEGSITALLLLLSAAGLTVEVDFDPVATANYIIDDFVESSKNLGNNNGKPPLDLKPYLVSAAQLGVISIDENVHSFIDWVKDKWGSSFSSEVSVPSDNSALENYTFDFDVNKPIGLIDTKYTTIKDMDKFSFNFKGDVYALDSKFYSHNGSWDFRVTRGGVPVTVGVINWYYEYINSVQFKLYSAHASSSTYDKQLYLRVQYDVASGDGSRIMNLDVPLAKYNVPSHSFVPSKIAKKGDIYMPKKADGTLKNYTELLQEKKIGYENIGHISTSVGTGVGTESEEVISDPNIPLIGVDVEVPTEPIDPTDPTDPTYPVDPTDPTDTEKPTVDGKSIDFSPLMNTNISKKFPFCLPFDLINAIKAIVAPAKAPRWEADIKGEKLIIDFAEFEKLATISRYFSTAIFSYGLILVSRNIMGGGS